MNAPERLPNRMQGTAEWFNARIGCLTASRMADAIATKKDGTPMKCRQDLMFELLAERMTGNAVTHYVNDAMRHGQEQEPAAKMAYEAATGNLVLDAPFVPHPRIEHCGASPDGFVDDGLVEIKCPTTPKHLTYLRNRAVPEEYRPQMLMQMACTGRRWCDFVSFDPRMPPPQQLLIVQYAPGEDEIAAIEDAARTFLADLDAMFDQITRAQP